MLFLGPKQLLLDLSSPAVEQGDPDRRHRALVRRRIDDRALHHQHGYAAFFETGGSHVLEMQAELGVTEFKFWYRRALAGNLATISSRPTTALAKTSVTSTATSQPNRLAEAPFAPVRPEPLAVYRARRPAWAGRIRRPEACPPAA